MWRPDAPWKTVARAVKVVSFPPGNINRASDSDLRQAVEDLKRRKIALAVGTGLLVRSDRCRSKSEAYVDPGALERLFGKLRRDGADVSYVGMDEPFYYGHRDDGGCHESSQTLARALKQSIAIVRRYFPNAQIGTEEVVDGSPTAAQDLALWADTYKAVVGKPLAFIDADETWTEPAVRNLVLLARALKARHVPLGVIYDADLSGNGSDAAWSRNTLSHVVMVESTLGVSPDHAVITTWVRHPSRVLPENQPGTLTNVVLRYIQARAKNGRN
jgi:hypothetical protein